MDELERLFLRLVSINSDNKGQLESFMDKHLLQVLAFLEPTSPATVKAKAMELLNHLSRRIKSNDEIQLPVAKLLSALQDGSLNQQFAVIYIRMGFPRVKDQSALLGSLLDAFDKLSAAQTDSLLPMAVGALLSLASVKRELWPPLPIFEKAALRRAVLDFFADLALAQPVDEAEKETPPGLTPAAFARVKSFCASVPQLEKTKKSVYKWLAASEIEVDEFGHILIFGLTDPIGGAELEAQTKWRKLGGQDMLESRRVLMKVIGVYMGTPKTEELAPAQTRRPADLRLRLQLLPLLIRSRAAAALFPLNIQVVFESLFGKQETGWRPRNPLAALLAGPNVGKGGIERLQGLSCRFASAIVQSCPDEAIKTFIPMIYTGMKTLLGKTEDSQLAARALGTLSQAGLRAPWLVQKDLPFVLSLFDDATKENEEAASAMTDCLNSWLPVFRQMDPAQRKVMETVVNTYVAHENRLVQQTALKYIEVVFPSSDIPSRWHLLLACASPREDIRREALRMLRSPLSTGDVPGFPALMAHLEGQMAARDARKEDFPLPSLREAVALARAALLHGAGCDIAELQHGLTGTREDRLRCGAAVSAYLADANNAMEEEKQRRQAAPSYARLILRLCKTQIDGESLGTLSELLACCPDGVGPILSESETLAWLQDQVPDMCKVDAGDCLGDILSRLHFVEGKLEQECERLLAKPYSGELEIAEPDYGGRMGALLYVGQAAARVKESGGDAGRLESAVAGWVRPARPLLDTEAACVAMRVSLGAGETRLAAEELAAAVEALAALATSIKDAVKPKLRELAVEALGAFLFPAQLADRDALLTSIQGHLIGIASGTPQPELELVVGEALLGLCLGDANPDRRRWWTESRDGALERIRASDTQEANFRLGSFVDSVIADKISCPNRHTRQAGLMWLFVVADWGWWSSAVQSRLGRLQLAFLEGLTEGSELSQDVASRGLGLVYEQGSAEQRKEMVDLLVASFVEGRESGAPVNKDTKLFSKGAFGKTPTGESPSTYGELCSLATEMGKPELIYKFMSLAHNNAQWNSRKGAAFGFGALMEKARGELEPYLPTIVPKLYRYQYDVQPKVQLAMRQIWAAITSGRKGVMDEFSEAIVVELLGNMTNGQWRVRESSCLALADLLSGHADARMSQRFGELFQTLFRVADDVKESVRTAAERALLKLSKVSVRFCSGSKGEALMGIILPILLQNGLKSRLEPVRVISLSTLTSLCRDAGPSLLPHLPLLVPALLESLNELEPALVNYLAVRADAAQLETLDSARSAAARTSPAMDALRSTLRVLRPQDVIAVAPSLAHLLRSSGAGLAARSGAASFLQAMAAQAPRELGAAGKPAADRLLAALESGLTDRNASLRRQFASCLGAVARFASDDALSGLMRRLQEKGLGAEEAGTRLAVAAAFRALAASTGGGELLKEFGPELAPLAFLATLPRRAGGADQGPLEAEIAGLWAEVWADLVPSTESGVRRYQEELTQFAAALLTDSPVWAIRSMAAAALGRIAEILAKDIRGKEMELILGSLIGGLGGRTWDGKEEVLKALQTLLKHCITPTSLSDEQVAKLGAVVLKECGRKKVGYRSLALDCAGQASTSVGRPTFAELCGLTEPFLSGEASVVAEEEGSDDLTEMERRNRDAEFAAAAFGALGAALVSEPTEEKVSLWVSLVAVALPRSYWRVQLVIVESIPPLLETKATILSVKDLENLLSQLLPLSVVAAGGAASGRGGAVPRARAGRPVLGAAGGVGGSSRRLGDGAGRRGRRSRHRKAPRVRVPELRYVIITTPPSVIM